MTEPVGKKVQLKEANFIPGMTYEEISKEEALEIISGIKEAEGVSE